MAQRNEARDQEIYELNKRIRNLETEKVIAHHVQEPKNSNPVQRMEMDTNASETNQITEMKSYLAEVMGVIQKFERQLTKQPATDLIPVDRS